MRKLFVIFLIAFTLSFLAAFAFATSHEGQLDLTDSYNWKILISPQVIGSVLKVTLKHPNPEIGVVQIFGIIGVGRIRAYRYLKGNELFGFSLIQGMGYVRGEFIERMIDQVKAELRKYKAENSFFKESIRIKTNTCTYCPCGRENCKCGLESA